MSLRPLRTAVEAWEPGKALVSDPLQRIAAAWPAIVGEHVAAHSDPVALNDGALTIATRSSAWSQQLQFLSPVIVAGIAALGADTVARVIFRSGAMRARPARRKLSAPASRAAKRQHPGDPPEPAIDAHDALQRLRRRLLSLRARARSNCRECGAALDAGTLCPPCTGNAEHERFIAAQRALYMTPWLGYTETREQIPALAPGEYERARRHLLQRWWLVLERARRAKTVAASGFERQVASAYVLLQTRLPPDRIEPAIVRNVLGAELESLLWGKGPDSSNTTGR